VVAAVTGFVQEREVEAEIIEEDRESTASHDA